MRLGLYHSCFLSWDLEKLFSWMAQQGMKDVELHGGPRYSHMDWRAIAKGRTGEVRRLTEKYGMQISDIMYGGFPFLDPDPERRERAVEDAMTLLAAARQLDIPSVSVFTGRDPLLSIEQNLDRMEEVFPRLLDFAARQDVSILLENCPMSHDWPPTHNIAFSPQIWLEIFDRLDSAYFGLNFDPSHLVWQDIDYLSAASEFRERIRLVQAKDSLRLPHVQRITGILDGRFWEHRIPGRGEVDWNLLTTTLVASGYGGPLMIEHEDPFYAGSEAAVKRGVLATVMHLRPLLDVELLRA